MSGFKLRRDVRIYMGAVLQYWNAYGDAEGYTLQAPDTDVELARQYHRYCARLGQMNLSSTWRAHWKVEAKRTARALEDNLYIWPVGGRVFIGEVDPGKYMTDDDISMYGAGPSCEGQTGTIRHRGFDGEGCVFYSVELDGENAVHDWYEDELHPLLWKVVELVDGFKHHKEKDMPDGPFDTLEEAQQRCDDYASQMLPDPDYSVAYVPVPNHEDYSTYVERMVIPNEH